MRPIIARMAPEDREQFASIWVPWLKSMGRSPEPEDLAIMADPAAYYRSEGGDAFLARLDGRTVGAVAVKELGEDGFEFCKMIVTSEARGHGLGRALVQTCLDFARDQGNRPLYLQSFNELDVALGLYRKMEFEDCPPPPAMNVLARTEVIMCRPSAAA